MSVTGGAKRKLALRFAPCFSDMYLLPSTVLTATGTRQQQTLSILRSSRASATSPDVSLKIARLPWKQRKEKSWILQVTQNHTHAHAYMRNFQHTRTPLTRATVQNTVNGNGFSPGSFCSLPQQYKYNVYHAYIIITWTLKRRLSKRPSHSNSSSHRRR